MKPINIEVMDGKCLATERSPCDSHTDERVKRTGVRSGEDNTVMHILYILFFFLPLQTPVTTYATATRTVCAPSSSVCPPGSASSNAWGVTVTPRELFLTWWTLENTLQRSLWSPSPRSTPHTEVNTQTSFYAQISVVCAACHRWAEQAY